MAKQKSLFLVRFVIIFLALVFCACTAFLILERKEVSLNLALMQEDVCESTIQSTEKLSAESFLSDNECVPTSIPDADGIIVDDENNEGDGTGVESEEFASYLSLYWYCGTGVSSIAVYYSSSTSDDECNNYLGSSSNYVGGSVPMIGYGTPSYCWVQVIVTYKSGYVFSNNELISGSFPSNTNASTNFNGYKTYTSSVSMRINGKLNIQKDATCSSSGTSFTYNGSKKTLSYSNCNVSGTYYATNAGSYTAYFTPKTGHAWSNGSTSQKTINWSISKANSSISCGTSQMNLIYGGSNGTRSSVSTTSGGTLSVSSGNTGVATASISSGTITVVPVGYGTATITVSATADGNHNTPSKVTFTVSVAKASGSISYATSSVNKTYGDAVFTNALTKTGDGSVTYSSSNTSVATVNSSTGEVTIIGAGSATITATVTDGTNYTYATKTATYSLSVNKAAGSISYTTTSISKTYGDSTFTNALTKTGDGSVTYSSSNTSVATVNTSTGAVTIVGAGSATITATVTDGTNYTYATKTASYSLNVSKASNPMSFSNSSLGTTFSNNAQEVNFNQAQNPQGDVTYEITSEHKQGDTTPTGYFSIPDSQSNALQIAGKALPGTYEINIKVTAQESDNYLGMELMATITLTINAQSLTNNAVITFTNGDSYVYTGSEITPTFTVIVDGQTLTANTDYTYTFTNNINAGTATLTLTGTGVYTGTATKTFTITPYTLTSSNTQIADIDNQDYTGSEIKPTPAVTALGKSLVSGTDFEYSYLNNINAGTSAKVIITGKGNFTGSVEKTFTINEVDPTCTEPKGISGLSYNGSAKTLIEAGVTSQGKFYYSLDNSTWQEALPQGTNATEYKVYWKIVGATNYNDITCSSPITVSISKATLQIPQNVAISTAGIVTWSAVTGATSYQISIDGTNWTEAYSGMDYRTTIIQAIGSRTVYVRALSTNSNYETSSLSGTASVNVYRVTIQLKTEGLTTYCALTQPSGEGNYIEGADVQITATIDSTAYEFDSWELGGSFVSTNNPYYFKMGSSSVSYVATVKPKTFTLSVTEVYEKANDDGKYVLGQTGGTVVDSSTHTYKYGDALPTPTVNDGFTFIGYYTTFSNSSLLNSYSGTTMPASNLTLYAGFERISYTITTTSKTTKATDNTTLEISNIGGTVSSNSSSVKFGNSFTLTATPNSGFKCKGFTNGAGTYISTGSNICNLTLSDASNQTYYAVFERETYNITKTEGTGTTIASLSSTAFYGQTIEFVATIFAGYHSLTISSMPVITINKAYSGNNCSCSFLMTNGNINISTSSTPFIYTLTFDKNTTSTKATLNGVAQGQVTYNTSDYSYTQNSTNKNGLPVPTNPGFTFKGWSENQNNTTGFFLAYNGTNFTLTNYTLTSNKTFYAIWEVQNPDFNVVISGNSTKTYNGEEQLFCTANLTNESDLFTYSYAWFKSGTSTAVSNSKQLKLRNVSESGSYFCKVTINENSLYSTSASQTLTIAKKDLNISFGTFENIGEYVKTLNSTDVELVSCHTFISGSLTFAESGTSHTYSNNVSSYVLNISSTSETSVASATLLENYNITFTGNATIYSEDSNIKVSVGVYERTIDSNLFTNIYSSTVFSSVVPSMSYSKGFGTEITTLNGIKSSYVLATQKNGTLTFSFANSTTDYLLFNKLKINGVETDVTINSDGNCEITLTDANIFDGQISIQYFFTKECLVNLDYGLLSGETNLNVNKIIQTKGQTANLPTPTRVGFTFEGWYFETTNTKFEGLTWNTTGETSLYAKWSIKSFTVSDVAMIVKDNDLVTTSFARDYNGNSFTLDYSLSDSIKNTNALTYSVVWQKDSANWTNSAIKNVSDSAVYSFVVTANVNYDSAQKAKYIANGTYSVSSTSVSKTITVNKKAVSLSSYTFSKNYDTTTSLVDNNNHNYIILTGVNSESLTLQGEYASANAGNNISLTNLAFENYGSSLANNYKIENENAYKGTITARDWVLTFTNSKYFDNAIYQSSTLTSTNEFGHTLSYKVKTSGVNVETYLASDLEIFDMSISKNSITISLSNYNITLSSDSSVIINKANLGDYISFSDDMVVYDAQNHSISIVVDGSIPQAITGYEQYYLQGDEVNKSSSAIECVNAGTYNICFTISENQNYYLLNPLTATLVIEQAELTLTYLINEQDIDEVDYSAQDIYSQITITASCSSTPSIAPVFNSSDLKLVVNGSESAVVVKDCGTYVLTAKVGANFKTTSTKTLTIKQKLYQTTDITILGSTATFSGLNLLKTLNDFSIANTTLPAGVEYDEVNSLKEAEIINVGNSYSRKIYLKVNDNGYALEQKYITVSHTVNSFEATTTNSIFTNPQKTYDGTNAFIANPVLTVTIPDGLEQNLELTGNYKTVNVGNNIALENIQIKDSTLGTNITLSSSLLASFTGIITKQNLLVQLYSNISTQELVQKNYNASTISISISTNPSSPQNLSVCTITGLVNDEYLTVTYTTNNRTLGEYTFANSGIIENNCKIYTQGGTEISNGIENYNVTTQGGIEIVENVAEAYFTLNSFTYSGEEVSLVLHVEAEGMSPTNYNFTYSSGKFVANGDSDLSFVATKGGTAVSQIKDSGTYTITLTKLNGYHLSKNSDTKTLEVVINKADLTVDLGTNNEYVYGNIFTKTPTTTFVGNVNEVYDDIEYSFIDANQKDVGTYTLNNTNISYTAPAGFNNFNITITGSVTVTKKSISINQNYSSLNIVYANQNLISTIETNVSVSFVGISLTKVQGETYAIGNKYWIEYYNSDDELINEIINVGTYTVKYFAKNFEFATSEFDFIISPAEVKVSYTVSNNLTYNKQNQKPVTFGFESGALNPNAEILNAQVFYGTSSSDCTDNSIVNAETYFAKVVIDNANYKLASSSQSYELLSNTEFVTSSFEMKKFEISSTSTIIKFEKYFGEGDPTLTKEIVVVIDSAKNIVENVELEFERVAGENVGFYALQNPSIISANENNFALSSTFINNYSNSFEIKKCPYNLLIELTNNIEREYKSSNYDGFALSDIIGLYQVKNAVSNALIDASVLAYNVDANFSLTNAKDVGSYDIAMSSGTSTTHSGVEFSANGFKFKIAPKTIIVTQNSPVEKTYDTTNSANVSDFSLNGVCTGDDISLLGYYIDNLNQKTANASETLGIKVELTGEDKDNYVVDFTTNYNNIINPKLLKLTGDLDKIYDRTSNVENSKLLFNTSFKPYDIDTVNFTGNYYKNDNLVYVVGNNYTIKFVSGNNNYVIENATGSITKRTVSIQNIGDLCKNYDMNSNISSTIFNNWILTNTIAEDNVYIVSAYYDLDPNNTIGSFPLHITLSDTDNYVMDNALQINITNIPLHIELYFGGENSNAFIFVNDGEVVENTKSMSTISDIIWNKSLNYVGKHLPTPTRTGYTFKGWIAKDFASQKITDYTPIDFTLESLSAVSNTIKLYADWEKETYEIKVAVKTEKLNGDYVFSNDGGSYDISSPMASTLQGEYTVYELSYYDSITFTPQANEHFTTNNTIVEIVNITESQIIVFEFEREQYLINISVGTNADVVWDHPLTWSWHAKTSTAFEFIKRTFKYEETFILPNITTAGASFICWKCGDDEYNIGEEITCEKDMNITATWQTSEFKVYVYIANDETISGSFAYDGNDEHGNYIIVEYNSEIGELPTLIKAGYSQNNWTLKYNGDITQTNIDEYFVWNLTENQFIYTLSANWNKLNNKFVFDSVFIDTYNLNGITDYNLPTEPIKSYYGTTENLGVQYALTEEQVVLSLVFETGSLYDFEYWTVDGVIIDAEKTISGVIYTPNGTSLTIKNFTWENDCPVIRANYTLPLIEITFENQNTNKGSFDYSITSESGIFENAGKLYTVAGANVHFAVSAEAGYEIDFVKVNNIKLDANSGATLTNASYTFNTIDANINIVISFKNSEFVLSLIANVEDDETDAYTLEYRKDINDVFTILSDNTLELITDEEFEFKLTISDGYSLVNWSVIDSGSLNINPNGNIYIAKYKDFTASSEMQIEIQKNVYTVRTAVMYKNLSGLYEDDTFSGNTAKIVYNANDYDEKDLKYKELFSLEYSVENQDFDVVDINSINQHLTLDKYVFVGWFVFEFGSYIKKDINGEILIANQNITYYAIFEDKKNAVSFSVHDDAMGELLTSDDNKILSEEVCVFGDSISQTIKAQSKRGYTFKEWKVTKNYNNEVTTIEYINQQQIDALELSDIVCETTCEAYFEPIEIVVNLDKQFIDETSMSSSKAKILYNNNEAPNQILDKHTSENISLEAKAEEGYEFVEWIVEADSDDFEIQETSLTQTTLNITFFGKTSVYNILAKFERVYNSIITKLTVDNGNNIGGGTFMDENGNLQGLTKIDNVLTEESLVKYICVLPGYKLEENVAYLNSYSCDVNINFTPLTIEELQSKLINTANLSGYTIYEFTISNFTSAKNIEIKLKRNLVYLNLCEIDLLTSELKTQIQISIYYGTSLFNFENNIDASILTPNSKTHTFMGWITDDGEEIITKEGKLVFDSWERNSIELFDKNYGLNLYQKWEPKKVKLQVDINPTEATVFSSYYSELFNNLSTYDPEIKGDGYYFIVKAKFGLSLPTTKQGYEFKSLKVLTITEDNLIKWLEIDGSEIENSSLFEVKDGLYYSECLNYADFTDYKDSVMYIQLTYTMCINLAKTNLYEEGRTNTTLGGNVKLNDDYTLTTYAYTNEEVFIEAICDEGYEFYAWKCVGFDGEVSYIYEAKTTIQVIKPMNCIAIFKGKLVEVTTVQNQKGSSTILLNGNFETISGKTYFHVGDIVELTVHANLGYSFINKWKHSLGGEVSGLTYEVKASDVNPTNYISLEPIFNEKNVNVKVYFEHQNGTLESGVYDYIITTHNDTDTLEYSYLTPYSNGVNLKIIPNDRYRLNKVTANINGNVIPLTVNNGYIEILSTLFNNADLIIINASFVGISWYEIINDGNYFETNSSTGDITILRNIEGKGSKENPYLIKTKEDLVFLSYIINHGMYQSDYSKHQFNTEYTYYEFVGEIDLSEKFFIPIGTKNNPFVGTVYISGVISGVYFDERNQEYLIEKFNTTQLEIYNNVFGCVGETGNIIYLATNSYITYIIVGGVVVVGIGIVLAIVFTYKRRNTIISTLEKKNNYAFDGISEKNDVKRDDD